MFQTIGIAAGIDTCMGELELLVVVNLAGCAESFGMLRTWGRVTSRRIKKRWPPTIGYIRRVSYIMAMP